MDAAGNEVELDDLERRVRFELLLNFICFDHASKPRSAARGWAAEAGVMIIAQHAESMPILVLLKTGAHLHFSSGRRLRSRVIRGEADCTGSTTMIRTLERQHST